MVKLLCPEQDVLGSLWENYMVKVLCTNRLGSLRQSKCDIGNKQPNFELYGKVICESGQKYCVQIDWIH